MSTDPLLQPLTIKGLTLKNRVMSTAHAPGYAENGLPGDRYQLYHEEKAKGGLALTMFGGSSTVSADSPSVFGQIDVSSDRCILPFQEFASRIHNHGCALMCQISHLGRRTRPDHGDWLPIVAPSRLREPQYRGFVKEIEPHDIARIVSDFASAARRCRIAGLDGVEVLTTSHLIGQFLSPAMNRRLDGYGGSLKGRARFAIEVLEAVRGAVGADFIISLRLSGDEMLEGGLSANDCLTMAKHLASSGFVDVLNVIGGNSSSEPAIAQLMPGMGTPTAPYLKFAAAMRAETGLPVFHATRITDIETARHAVVNGMLDMVALTRSHMADPEIVAKLARGETDRIRPCVGARYCLDRGVYGGAAVCLHNPAMGREKTVPQLIRKSNGKSRRVVVVGGGPAGLEAARVSALRGHRVTLFEAGAKLGGQVLIAARARGRAEIAEVVGWLARENEHAQVEIHTSRYLDGADVRSLDPDIVIDATGGLPSVSDVDDPDGVIVSTWDILSGQKSVTGDVLFYDDHGGHQGLSCAATLSTLDGVRLEIATPERSLGVELGATNRPQYLECLYDRRARTTPDLRLVRVARDGNRIRASLRNVYTDECEDRVYDHVVVEAGTAPNVEMYDSLAPLAANSGRVDLDALAAGQAQPIADTGFNLWRVGDAIAHRGIHAAILDSRRLCQNL